MKDIEKKYFGANDGSAFLNGDDAPFSIGANQWVNAENCRTGSTDAGQINTVESIGSNVLKSVALPSVTFLSIGSAEDIPRKRFFSFKYNATGTNHKITCFDTISDTEMDVLLSSQVTGGLNFSKDYPIHSCFVIDDELFWAEGTDHVDNLKRINVEAALKLNNPSYVTTVTAYTSPLDQNIITIIRMPPGTAPTAAKATDGGVTTNLLDNFAGSFAFRYANRDGEYTVFGPASNFINYNRTGDTFNRVDVIFGIGTGASREQIPQDAQIVELGVRFGNDNEYNIIKKWNRNVTADATEIANYNAGIANLSFQFFNDFTGETVAEIDSIKLADSVPLIAKAICLADNRVFVANYTKGYNTPTTTSLTGTPSLGSGSTSTIQVFRPFSTYQIAIRFRDRYKRQCAVVTNDSLVVTIQLRSYDDATYTTAIAWALSNALALIEIPDWAYFYDILITKNLQTRFFVQSKSPNTRYAVKNSDGTFTYQTNFSSSVYALALDASLLFGVGMGYSFQEGDIANVIVISNNYYLNVIGQDANYILVKPEDLGDLSTPTTGNQSTMFDVYTPYKPSTGEFFYATGNAYNVLNPGTDLRSYSTLSGSISGDCWRFRRLYQGSTYYFTQCMSPNDTYWKDWFQIYGERNIQTELGQVAKKRFIAWSNVQLEGTKVNGLCSFDALNEKALPDELTEINRIILTSKVQNQQGNVMLAYGVGETASLYLSEVQTYGANQQEGTVNTVADVIGTVNILKGSFGTTLPECVTEYRGNVFSIDLYAGKVIQYSNAGLFPISEYKMTRFWKLWCAQFLSMTAAEIEAFGGRPFVFMTVDPRHEELLISLPKLSNTPPKGYLPDYPSTIYPFDIYDLQGKVMVYELNIGRGAPRWKGAMTFYTEGFTTLLNQLYTYKNGLVWLHNQTTGTNNFYGVQYNSKIMCVSNKFPNNPKVYNGQSVEGNMKPYFVYLYNDYPYQQATDLVDFDPNWREQEGIFYASYYNNKLIPTATGYSTDGLFSGEKMRGAAMFAMYEFNPTTTFLELKFVNFNITPSRGHDV